MIAAGIGPPGTVQGSMVQPTPTLHPGGLPPPGRQPHVAASAAGAGAASAAATPMARVGTNAGGGSLGPTQSAAAPHHERHLHRSAIQVNQDTSNDRGGAYHKGEPRRQFGRTLSGELQTKDEMIAQLQNHIAAQHEQFLQDSVALQQNRDQCYESYTTTSHECAALQQKLDTATKLLRKAKDSDHERVRRTASERQAANVAKEKAAKEAEEQAAKEVEAVKFQQDMQFKWKVKQLKKEHQVSMKRKLDVQQYELAELQGLNAQLRKDRATAGAEALALQVAMNGSTTAIANLHAQIAAQGDAIGSKAAELKDERLQRECLQDEVVILKDVLSKMSKENAAAAASAAAAAAAKAQPNHY